MPEYSITRSITLDYACQEAINTLCTNLSFLGTEKRRLLFTSAHPHEGKSFVSLSVAMTLSKLGYSVVLVDADLRRSQLSSRYGIVYDKDSMMGLTHYLAGKCPMGDMLHYSRTAPMCLIPVRRTVTNSLALLSTTRFSALLDKLSSQFDFVIIDTPPLGAVIDAAEIAKHCDGSVLVIKYNSVSHREALEIKHQLERVDCPVLGAVLNDVDFKSLSSKKYYNKSYYYRYGNDYHTAAGRKTSAAMKKTP
ncbi:MAG: CpsD/CapB family tyrosine-protein kinase [Clostridia bacterium]|nr:CpsD/CapB family tyrosine-protein kinase [Clostridia bacterium]